MRRVTILALPVILSGCAAPVGLSAVSYTADGLSLSASGKSMNDHLISQVVDMDCGLFRVFRGEWICREKGLDPDDDTLYLADAETIEGAPRPWGTMSEPKLNYDSGVADDAREWADGIVLAEAPVRDDPSGALVTHGYAEDRDEVVHYIGQRSARRERQEKIGRVKARMLAIQEARLRAANGQTSEQVAAAPLPMIVNPDRLEFGDSLGLQETAPARGSAAHNVQFASAAAAPAAAMPANAQWSETSHRTAAVRATVPTATPVAVRGQAPTKRLGSGAGGHDAGDYYVVVGSYRTDDTARHAAGERAAALVSVVASRIRGETYYRLIAGPYREAELDSARRTLTGAGFPDSWLIRPCTSTRTAPASCLDPVQTALVESRDAATTTQVAVVD